MDFVKMKYTLQLVCVTLFICCSGESPVDPKENSTIDETPKLAEESQHYHTVTGDNYVPQNGSVERWNHSSMLLKTTTLGYDEWWFLTTQRTPVSYKDFPGRPGVATWKEIGSNEGRNSRKMKNTPTAEAVNSSWKLYSKHLWTFVVFYFSIIHFLQNQ